MSFSTSSAVSATGNSACHTLSDDSSQPPALDPVSEGDDSSLDDSMNSRQSKHHHAKKHVSWASIHTREYALVVGDHPMCQDGLPVSLGWRYNVGSPKTLLTPQHQQQQVQVQGQVRERLQSYVFPRRLSYEERRNRLVSVSDLTLDQIKNDEIDLVVRTLKESWEDNDEQPWQTGEAHIDDQFNGNICMDMEDDPLAEMIGLDDMMMPGIDIDLDGDLGDITDFEWTDKR